MKQQRSEYRASDADVSGRRKDEAELGRRREPL